MTDSTEKNAPEKVSPHETTPHETTPHETTPHETTQEKIGFRMQLLPGKMDEYRKRHDGIWPELVTLLKEAGVSDYSIFYHEPTQSLFATLYRTQAHTMDALPANDIMQRWWAHMADIMETHESNEPVVEPLDTVFHMD